MKSSLASLALGLSLLALPAVAQQTGPAPRQPLDQAASKLGGLAPTTSQSGAMMEILMRELPYILDANSDTSKRARTVGPEIERLLSADQMQMLRAMDQQSGTADFGATTRAERRGLMKDGLKRLHHADEKEWLKRIDSFDL